MPSGRSSSSHRRRAGLYTESVTSTWSPAFAAAKNAIVIEDIPVGDSATPSPPSPARRIRSSARVVGVPSRPYTDIVRSPACIASSVSRRSATLSKSTVDARRISGAGVRKRPRFMVIRGRIAALDPRARRREAPLLQDGEGVEIDPAVATDHDDLDLVRLDGGEGLRPDQPSVRQRLPEVDRGDEHAVELDLHLASTQGEGGHEADGTTRERVGRASPTGARVAHGAPREQARRALRPRDGIADRGGRFLDQPRTER